MNPTVLGGQAVVEGVMMRGGNRVSIAVRTPPGNITVTTEDRTSLAEKYPILKWPLLRGAYTLIESTLVGIQALTTSTNLASGEEDERLSAGEMTLSLTGSLTFALLLFVIAPVYAAKWLTHSAAGFALLEGGLRLFLFIGYLLVIRRMKEIKRVFQYHGAEHKTINCHEAGLELTVDNIRGQSLLHKRCGTSFLMFVVLLSILVFSFFSGNELPIVWKIASRILLMPVIAGFAYEIIRYSGTHDQSWVSLLAKPGFWMQRLTTEEPDDSQIEVAIESVKAVLNVHESRAAS